MKLIFSILSAFLLFVSHCYATENLSQAENYYRQGKYAMALSTYESELKNSPNNPFVYYNIGNCYFKMGSRGLAIANYFRAFNLAPRDTDIRGNLSLALEASGESLVLDDIPEVLHKLFYSLSYGELKGLSYLLIWIGCFCFVIWVFNRKFKVILIPVLILLSLSSIWWYFQFKAHEKVMAVVAFPTTELRSGPGNNFPASASLGQGHLVFIEDSKDAWVEVIVRSQDIKGWVEANTLEKI